MTYSVIIPAYNCGGDLKKTVESVRRSGIRGYEIIIVDDGSTDNTPEILAELSGKYSGLRYIQQDNMGVSSARNRGIDEASGDYILFVDADDSIVEGALAKACDAAEEYRPDMVVFGLSFDYYHRGRLYRRDDMFYPEKRCFDRGGWKKEFAELYGCNGLTPVWNKLIRREMIVSGGVRFINGITIMEDFLFVLDCLKHCGAMCVLPDVIYRYRQSEDERRPYERLSGINDLAEYMRPFEKSIKALDIDCGQQMVNSLYMMLFRQRMYYSGVQEIKTQAEELLNGRFYGELQKSPYLTENDRRLLDDISRGRYLPVRLKNIKTNARHKIAVLVKQTALYQRLKGNKW